MKISTILDHIDSGHMALPEFQRGYVWNRQQVRALMDSLYRRHPVGSLLVWATQSEGTTHRGEGHLASGVVNLLLDGQQRMTSLYGIVRGKPPEFFEGNSDSFTGLHFHLEREEFGFYSPVKMQEDPLWIDVTKLMLEGGSAVMNPLKGAPGFEERQWDYMERVQKLRDLRDIELHIEEVTGADKTIDVVVDIFNRVNSSGTTLSKGDLALAKICATTPDARGRMQSVLARWRESGYHFSLDWLLRVVNTVATGEAKFTALHDVEPAQFDEGLNRAERHVDELLNMLSGRLGLDHDRVLFGRFALPVMARYLDQRGGKLENQTERDKLVFWYLQNAMWGRFSASTESTIDKDLKTIEELEGGVDRLLSELRLWRGALAVEADHFAASTLGARFYPVLYILTRVAEAKDWGTGLPLTANLLGKMSRLEVHHIFPKARLYKAGYNRSEVNAIANFCFLTKNTNLKISDDDPAVYFEEIEERYPGALASQWVPMDRNLWHIDHYLEFLDARRTALAAATNSFFRELLHGDEGLLGSAIERAQPSAAVDAPGGVESEEEEQALLSLNEWIVEQGLPEGVYPHEVVDPDTGNPMAILDLAWPDGLQPGYSTPVAVLLNEGADTLRAAHEAGFRYFTSSDSFRRYVEGEVIGRDESGAAAE